MPANVTAALPIAEAAYGMVCGKDTRSVSPAI
jgi:hypothetical protein